MPAISLFTTASRTLPEVSSMDLADIHPPYVHLRRQPREFILYLVLSGEMYLTEGRREYTLRENDLLLLSPELEHFGRKPSVCRFYYIHFTMPGLAFHMMEENPLREQLRRERLLAQQPPASAALLRQPRQPSDSDRLYRRICLPKYLHFEDPQSASAVRLHLARAMDAFAGRRHYHHLETACILYELLLEISRDFTGSLLYADRAAPGSGMAAVDDMISYFNRCYAEKITGDSISQRYRRNFDYLNRCFKKATGQTILAYVNGLRVERAKQLLNDPYYSISEIAEKTGFHDVYYFSRVFKSYTGLPPGRYRTQ